MKINNKLTACTIMFMGIAALCACSDDETYDVYGSNENRVFFDPDHANVQQNEVYNTPAGIFGLVGGAFYVRAQYATDASFTVSATADTSYVSEFNKNNETASTSGIVYHTLPAEALNALVTTPATIKPGTSKGDTTITVTIPTDKCGSLTEEYYVVPLRLNLNNYQGGTSGYKGGVSADYSIAYAVIHNAGSEYIVAESQTANCAIVNTPVGVFGGISAKFKYGVKVNTDKVFTIKAEVDNSLLASYNSEHGTNYEQLPANVASQLKITDGVISAGKTETDTPLSVTCPDAAAQTLKGDYLIPLKVTFVYPNGTTAELPPSYIIVQTKNSFINDDANELVGKPGDGKGWEAIDCVNLDPSAFANMFKGSSWSRRWRLLDGGNPYCQFTVDLKETKDLVGFNASSYAMKDFDVEVSSDNATWTSLGNTAGHKKVSSYDPTTYISYEEYVLYGSVKCRYVRFKINFDTSGYRWRYYKYLNAVNLFFNE